MQVTVCFDIPTTSTIIEISPITPYVMYLFGFGWGWFDKSKRIFTYGYKTREEATIDYLDNFN